MPLVGVPSFIEFSQKRDLRYFFVLVHKQEGSDSQKQRWARSVELGTPRVSSPMEAFMAASSEEPWGERVDATSQESAEAKLDAESTTGIDEPAAARPTVSLPLNAEVRFYAVNSLSP